MSSVLCHLNATWAADFMADFQRLAAVASGQSTSLPPFTMLIETTFVTESKSIDAQRALLIWQPAYLILKVCSTPWTVAILIIKLMFLWDSDKNTKTVSHNFYPPTPIQFQTPGSPRQNRHGSQSSECVLVIYATLFDGLPKSHYSQRTYHHHLRTTSTSRRYST